MWGVLDPGALGFRGECKSVSRIEEVKKRVVQLSS